MGDSAFRWTVCGASAGLAVDLGLYPLDTIKTRIQSKDGFRAAGGFTKIYSGMGSVAIGSAPGAALFFLSYEYCKRLFVHNNVASHAAAASVGEVVACLIRVPTELIKQRAQATKSHNLTSIAKEIYQRHGLTGFYRGYSSTIAREIPFAVIQYPLWEFLKKKASPSNDGKCSPVVGAACGSVAGAISAGLTTPLDVAKTRIMLSKADIAPTVANTLREVYSTGGVKSLYAGLTPRVLWISIGGFVYFGAYESVLKLTYWIAP
ncbi:unnamed protein product [Auanema sp. JU1783]|nr:unnamed protein product [Auanema sp. JU1783]